jgi:predicted ATPase
MLQYLRLKNVGPASQMRLDFASRLNLITGDNGLGKSFLLDIGWWAMTRRWPAEVNANLSTGLPARPTQPGAASIQFAFTAKVKREKFESTFKRADQAWSGRPGRPANPGLVLYALVDGSFAAWDPARNYWRKDVQDRPRAYVFSPKDVWDGLPNEDGTGWLCNGLIRDWASWQHAGEGSKAFKQLRTVLGALSGGGREPLEPGELTRISLDDVRDMPTLRMAYGTDVPVVHASAGMRRIVALAYLLVWAWQEHRRASELLGQKPALQVTFLIDEIESHLHPRWQRVVVQSLLSVVKGLATDAQVQLVTTTHSPLVLASVEPVFDARQDAWFDLDLVKRDTRRPAEVALERRDWVRHGDAARWLTSEAFDLRTARSLEAEEALERAAIALSDEAFDKSQASRLDKELRRVLGDTDPFWTRWRFVGEKRGWLR